MTDAERDDESTDARIDRRTVLKGTAAAGVAGTGLAGTASASDDDQREITFCAAGEETFSYFVRVSGSLERGGTYESDEYDAVGDDFAEGAVSAERCDSFAFTGDVGNVKLNGPGKVFVDGDLLEDTTDDEETLPNKITIQGEDTRAEYKFRVSGRVEPDDSIESSDEVSDSAVRGAVNSGSDVFRYSGAIAFDEADGPVTVTLDVNPD
ncbi:twin-arginine translocation signal domain-containing protein [Halorussus aquaticus]|uniref:Twin-arginine translocation signal domain-containing protein n=1 Tax=Halorussus aquaticus TaxID=2953748 RepID=A0ABD5Q6J5_9EURY|nr:twin-arginine translocation signal domain-containing protein [Halorussus aquaticus]